MLGIGNWSVSSTSNTSKTFGGLSNNTFYEWRVKAFCNGDESNYSITCTFQTGNSNSGDCNSNPKLSQSEFDFNFYPNPVKDVLTVVSFGIADEVYQLQIYNALGKLMYSQRINQSRIVELDISNFNPGIYFIKLDKSGDQFKVKKLIVH